MSRRRRHRYSANAAADTPLALEYRAAREAYQRAGERLRRSCEAKRRVCGYDKAPPGRDRARWFAKNADEMRDQFLTAPAPGGSNEEVLNKQLGHLTARDKTQWEEISEKYETGPLYTFDDAFRVLARESKHGRSRPDWRHFDMAVLRSCPGLEQLEYPEWFTAATLQAEEGARYYGEEAPF